MTLRSWLRYGSNPPGPAWDEVECPWNIPQPLVCNDPRWIVGRGRWVDAEWWPWLPWRLRRLAPSHYRKGRLYSYPLCCILEFCWDDIVCRVSGELRGNVDPWMLAGWVPCRRCLRRSTVKKIFYVYQRGADVTVAEMGMHVDRLAAEHDVAVTWRDSGSKAYTDQRRIAIRLVRSEVTYAVALHELGHILAEGGRGQFWMDLDAEVCAWEWALRNADTVGPRFRATVKRGLQSHYNWALRERNCTPRTLSFQAYLAARNSVPSLPPSDDRFWALKRNGCLCPEAHEGICPQ